MTWTVYDIQTAVKDKAGNMLEGVVAKSVGETGYIKYSSGFKVQWGQSITDANGLVTMNFPISFDERLTYKIMARITGNINDSAYLKFPNNVSAAFSQAQCTATGVRDVAWIALGF